MTWPRNVYAIWLKLDCLNPNVQWWNRTLIGSTSDTDAMMSYGFGFLSVVRLASWTMSNELIEGHEWGA